MKSNKTTKRSTAGSARPVRGRPFEKGHKYAWKKGQSGNPSGTSKAQTLGAAYRHALKEPLPNDPRRTYADAVAETLCKNAMAGDVGAAKELADRTEGRPTQSISFAVEKHMREIFDSGVAIVAATYGISREEAARLVAEGVNDICPQANDWIN